MQQLTITRPDDWHLHLRDGEALKAVLPHSAHQFARAIVMPNLKPPIRSVEDAAAYRDRILAAIPTGQKFEPLMTLYLTDKTSPEEIIKAKASKFVKAVKYYPAGATTNSDFGVTDIRRCDHTFATMEQEDIPLLLHGEVTHTHVDIFDREKVFIAEHLIPDFPNCVWCLSTSLPRKLCSLSSMPTATSQQRSHLNIYCSAVMLSSKVASAPIIIAYPF